MRKQILTALAILILSISSLAQNQLKVEEFEYVALFQQISILCSDGSKYYIDNIIITDKDFIISKYEQTPIKVLYSNTQNYFKSLLGKRVSILDDKGDSSEKKLFKLENGGILNYEILEKGIAVCGEKPHKDLEEFEKRGFDLNNKNSLANYIFLLSMSFERKEEARLLFDLYKKKYEMDYFWHLLQSRVLDVGLDSEEGDYAIERKTECYKKALGMNPKLIDLNYYIAREYSENFSGMITGSVSRNYADINECIKYSQAYIKQEKDMDFPGLYLRLAKAYHLIEDNKKSYDFLMKYFRFKDSDEEFRKEESGIKYVFEVRYRDELKIDEYIINDVMELVKDYSGSSKLKVYRELNGFIKSGEIKFYEPTEQDEIKISEIEKKFHSTSLEYINKVKPRIMPYAYIALVSLILTLSIIIVLQVRKKRKTFLYFLSGVLFLALIGLFMYSKTLSQNIKSHSFGLEKSNAKIVALEEKKKKRRLNKKKAIELARKEAWWIEDAIKKEKGEIIIIGWEAEEKEDDIYLVSFKYDKGDLEGIGWFFEVQISAGLVRSVIGDEGLEKKYGLQRIEK